METTRAISNSMAIMPNLMARTFRMGPLGPCFGTRFSAVPVALMHLETSVVMAARKWMLLSKPHIESVIWTDLFDHDETVPPHAGLITETGAVKNVLKRLISLRKQLSKPLGPAAAPPTS